MSNAMRMILFASALIATALFSGAIQAQMQPSSGQQGASTETGDEINSYTRSTSSTHAANILHGNGGSSIWTAGRSSFGRQSMPTGAANSAGITVRRSSANSPGSSSWVAGRGRFGSTAQQDGIWRDNSGFSALSKPTSGSDRSATSSGLNRTTSAFDWKFTRTPAARSAGSHTTHLGEPNRKSQLFPESTSGRTIKQPNPAGSINRMTTPSHRSTSIDSGTDSSRVGSTVQSPSLRAPSAAHSTEEAAPSR